MADDSSLDAKTEEAVKAAVSPQLIGVGATYGAALVGGAIAALIAVNYKSSTMAGDNGVHPTNNETGISTVKTSGVETDGALAVDSVEGASGSVKANETDATALTGEATAMDSGATALRTKAGASDIETKALKMT
ncbi:MAG: hypothetical protein LBK63_01715 [Treponema sp.]|jgi:hypothetical protein|nr:hypothetical protein [Treponema sp.]